MYINNSYQAYQPQSLTPNDNSVKVTANKSDTTNINSPANTTVEISEEANRLYLQSLKNDESDEKTEANSKNTKSEISPQGALNAMIAELEDKLKKLLEKIARLKAKGDEESLQEANALEAQAGALSGQLSELINQKMASAQVET